jgi:hypothetical protein
MNVKVEAPIDSHTYVNADPADGSSLLITA